MNGGTLGVIAVGAVMGWVVGLLLRRRAKLSYTFVGAGVVGAGLGAVVNQAAGPNDSAMWPVVVLVSAMIASFALCARVFTTERSLR